MIHIMYGMTDKSGHFSKYPAVSITSVFENTGEKITIHFVHDSTLTADNKNKFIALCKKYDQQIKFYNVDEIFSERMQEIRDKFNSIEKFIHWEVGALYRLLAPELIQLPKIIYLDTDIVVNLDIKELWSIDLKNSPMAAKLENDMFPTIPPYDKKLSAEQFNELDFNNTNPKKICNDYNLVDYKKYFCSAVMVYNLDILRNLFDSENTTLIDSSLDVLSRYALQYIDQDALNYLFSEVCYHLPAKFNVFVYQSGLYMNFFNLPKKLQQWIYHYSGYNQGFQKGNPFFETWFKYLLKSGFFDVEMLLNLAEDFYQQLDHEREKFQSILNQMKQLGIIADDMKFNDPTQLLTRAQGGTFKDDRKIIMDM